MNMDDYGFEDWEGDALLFEDKDWPNLLILREDKLKKNPSDLYAQQRYAEALILNERFSDALDFITPVYNENYEFGFGVSEIIQALRGLGKSESDFDWIIEPKILKLDANLLSLCVDYLKSKRKRCSVTDIFCDLIMNGDYWDFNEEQLGRFLFENKDMFDIKLIDKSYYDMEIMLKKD